MSGIAIDLYEPRRRLHPRFLPGRFQRLRMVTRVLLLGAFFVGPHLRWDGAQALLLDLPARRFHIFGSTFFADDVVLATGLLIAGAFALFTVTNFLGRVWCGYACPQSVWFSWFIGIERLIEGNDRQQKALDDAPLNGRKLRLRTLKYAAFALIAMATAITAVGYFVPIRELPEVLMREPASWAGFWLLFFFLATFIAGGLLREQVCFYMCPYARFQSVMFDGDTFVVAYDTQRGEPRGGKSKEKRNISTGDCVDCELCVRVCPVGIDIRDGLQYQCIHCALCIDACDGVMQKTSRPQGLIRYASENELTGKKKQKWRPRLLGYLTATAVTTVGLLVLAAMMPNVDFDVMRERRALFREVLVGGQPFIENGYRLHLTNKLEESQQLSLSLRGMPMGWQWRGDRQLTLSSGESAEIPVRVLVPKQAATDLSSISFLVTDQSGSEAAVREQRFFAEHRDG